MNYQEALTKLQKWDQTHLLKYYDELTEMQQAALLQQIDETDFSNNCLEQGKYEYEYDEKSKLLTVICEYGEYGDDTVFLKEEYDTGFMSYEFELE